MFSKKIQQVKDRILFISPQVQAGFESELKFTDFKELKRLGQGAFGKVIKCEYKKNQKIYALKQISKQQVKNSGMQEQIRNEVKIMYELKHENIIYQYNHFEDDDFIYLVLEFASGGQLYENLNKQFNKRFPQKIVAKMILQVIAALEYLHSKGIVHRDLKPENILIDSNGNMKLADFGWSNYFKKDEVRTTYCGTIDYLAPEMISNEHYHDFRVDIWSVSVLIYELLTGKAPFSPLEAYNSNMSHKMVELLTKENIKNLRFAFPPDFPELARPLIVSILQKDPKSRPTWETIKNDKWFRFNELGKPIAVINKQLPIPLIPQTETNTNDQINSAGLKPKVEAPTGAKILTQEYINKKIDQAQQQIQQEPYDTNLMFFKPDELKNLIRPDSLMPEYFDPQAQISKPARATKKKSLTKDDMNQENQKDEFSNYMIKMNILKNEKETSERNYQKKKEECERLKAELEKYKTGSGMGGIIDNTQFEKKKLEALEETLKRIQKENFELNKLCLEKDQKIQSQGYKLGELSELKKKFEVLKEEKNRLRDENDSLKSKYNSLQRELVEVEEENLDQQKLFKSNGNSITSEFSQQMSQLSPSQYQDYSAMRIALREKDVEIESLRNKVRNLENRIEHIKEDIDTQDEQYKREVDRLRMKYEAQANEKEFKLNESRNLIAINEGKIADLQKILEQANSDRDILKTNYLNFDKLLQIKNNEIQVLKDKLEKTEYKFNEFEKNLNTKKK